MADKQQEIVLKTIYNTSYEITRIYDRAKSVNETIEKAVASDSKLYSIETIRSL